MDTDILLGNEAVGLGLVTQGFRLVTSYPGTPISEIPKSVNHFSEKLEKPVYVEWSSNEKVAFEVSLAASWSGLRAAVVMKNAGLNVAADPLFSSAYTGVKGAFIIIVGDDPGPTSSQTEEDSRMLAMAAHIPVLEPAAPAEVPEVLSRAVTLSEQYQIPVMLRLTTRVCHSLQPIKMAGMIDNCASENLSTPVFEKTPMRWTATPTRRYKLHRELNEKLGVICREFTHSSLNKRLSITVDSPVGIVASGPVTHIAQQALSLLDIDLPLLKVATPYPLPSSLVMDFINEHERTIILEETGPCIEYQLPNRERVIGRLDGVVPNAGELTPEVVSSLLAKLLQQYSYKVKQQENWKDVDLAVGEIPLPNNHPRLCPGCSHRSVFHSIKVLFGSEAIYPGDIGCYTLGMNIDAVDTFLNMGASISMASGFYRASLANNDPRPIIATIGDSTFLHSGIHALLNAVHTNAKFILLILDNHVTAMTGMQPTPVSIQNEDGLVSGAERTITELVRACGVKFVERVDPYDQVKFRQVLMEADRYTRLEKAGVSVVLAEHACVLQKPEKPRGKITITNDCDTCGACYIGFECPSLHLDADKSKVEVEYDSCTECGQCLDVCSRRFIQQEYNSAIVPVAVEIY